MKKESGPKKVLLIDGEYREAYPVYEVMTEVGSGAFDLEYTDRLSAGLERLARGGIDVLLLAPGVSDSSDLNSLARRRARAMGVPVVTLSAFDDEVSEIEILKKGSREYLAKKKSYGDQLVRSINHAIKRQRLASEKAPPSRWPESGETRLLNIIRSVPDGIIIVDRRGIVRFVNPAVESLFKCKAERLLGETLDFLSMVEDGKTELSIIREDGKKGTAEIRLVETRYRGEPAYLVALRDITERKKAEAKMKTAMEAAETRAKAAKESAEAEIKSAEEAAEVKIIAAEEAAQAKAAAAEEEAQARITAAEEEAQAAKVASEEAVASAEESARLAWEETEAIKTSSQEAVAKAEEQARIAKEETEAIKVSSREAFAKAEEQARLAREEADKARTASEVAIARAEEQARVITEEATAVKNTAQDTITKAEEQARLVREEALTARITAQEAVAKAEKEARLAREDAEAAKIAMQEALVKAEKETEAARTTSEEAITRAEEEARIAREETEAVKIASQEAIAKAEEEVRLTREETEAVKTASQEAIARAEQETESVKTALQEAIARAEEELHLAREEAETAKSTAQESILNTEKKAKKDKDTADNTVARLEKELRSIDPMQSEFMSNIVHEMRAPLHSITGFTRLVLEGGAPDAETQQEFLNIIADQSEHLRRLIDELVDISPAPGQTVKLQKELVSVKDLLRNAVKEIYSVAKQRNISLKHDIPESLPEIDGDSQRLRQVMFNLLGNAIKFNNKRGSVNVKAEVRNNDLLVQITDQGVGITRDAIPYIFDKYYKAENTASAGGLGLGLYISKQIIEAHGGEIWAESTEGTGSTFSFTLPLKHPDR